MTTIIRARTNLSVKDRSKVVDPTVIDDNGIIKRGAEVAVTWSDHELYLLQGVHAIEIVGEQHDTEQVPTIDDESEIE